MDNPLPLVCSLPSRGVGVNNEALKVLKTIDKPVVVVAIAGLYRTGKSYIMNRLFGETKGFELGSTVQAKTKGIWMWCRPHPKNPERYLVLLDTEGLSDPEEGDAKYDMAIFSLAILLSSCFIYNSTGAIDQHSIDQLHLVSKLTEHIKIKSSAGDESGEDFDKLFPTFIWAVRDFTLEKKIDGKEVTADEYLEHCLELKSGVGQKISNYNLPRQVLKTCFKNRRCFTMPRPCNEDKLKYVEDLRDYEINKGFLNTMKELIEFIHDKVETKKVFYQDVNGSMLGGLAESYVESITKGGVPCIESAVESVSKIECQQAIKNGTERYLKHIRENLKMPASLDGYFAVHQEALKLAIETFSERAIFDNDHVHQKRLQEEIDVHHKRLYQENIEVSRKKCEEFLGQLYEPIKEQVLNGSFLRPDGYKAYLAERERIKKAYSEKCEWLGADAVFSKFVNEKKTEQMQIMGADKQLSAFEREKEETKAELEASQAKAKKAEEEKMKLQEETSNKEKTFRAHIEELEKRHSQEMESYKRSQEQLLDNRLKNQQELLRRGHEEEAKLMHSLIYELRLDEANRCREHREFIDKLVNAMLLNPPQQRQAKEEKKPSSECSLM